MVTIRCWPRELGAAGRRAKPMSNSPLVPSDFNHKPAARSGGRPAAVADCPRCEKKLLRPATAGNAQILRCYECAGAWVPHRSAADLKDSFPEVGNLSPEKLEYLRHAAAELNLKDGVRYLACPICKDRMSRRQFALGSGIVVDRCIAHGVWFDAGELELAAAYFEVGGPVDAAKRYDQKPRTARIPIVDGNLGEPATSAMAKLLLWLIE